MSHNQPKEPGQDRVHTYLPASIVDIVVSDEITTSDKVEQRALCMEAEGMHRSSEVKEGNRVLKAAMEKLKQRETELADLNERPKDLCRAKTGFFQGFL